MSTADSILPDLEFIIDSRDPLPLRWVVANGDAFEHAWHISDSPRQMLRIAAHVVPRPQLTLAAAAIARTVLKYVPKSEKRPLRAIEAAEGWARGEVTNDELYIEYFASMPPPAHNGSAEEYAHRAAYHTISAAIESGHYQADMVVAVAGHAFNAAKSTCVSYRLFAKIVRKHIKITVANLVKAGRNGWQP